MPNVRSIEAMLIPRKYVAALLLISLTACTKQQYYEGLKAERRTECLEYPVSEYEDCIDETQKSFEEYSTERKEVIGN
jgi:hypothetical protein